MIVTPTTENVRAGVPVQHRIHMWRGVVLDVIETEDAGTDGESAVKPVCIQWDNAPSPRQYGFNEFVVIEPETPA